MEKNNCVRPSRWTLKRKAHVLADKEVESMVNKQKKNTVDSESLTETLHKERAISCVTSSTTFTRTEKGASLQPTLDSDLVHSGQDSTSHSLVNELPYSDIISSQLDDEHAAQDECDMIPSTVDASLSTNYQLNIEHEEEEVEKEHFIPPSMYLPLLSVSFYLKDKLTKTSALKHHLQILDIATGSSIDQLRSTHLLLAKYQHLKTTFRKTFVCSNKKCTAVLELDNDGTPVVNQKCGHKRAINTTRDCYVLSLDVEKQLVYFIKQHGLEELALDPNCNGFRSDVRSGDCYRQLVKDGTIDSSTITLQLNTDGAQNFKTSKYSFWPLMGVINEAPYRIRRSHVILIALWFDNRKPPRDAFLQDSIEQLVKLQEIGFMVNEKTYKVRVLVVTTDTMARPVMRNTTQFNGAFGCDFCLAEGKRVGKGAGSVRVYPNCDHPSPLRDMVQHKRDVVEAETKKIPVNGVQGGTPLLNIPGLDLIKACVPEYMHSGCQGVIKQLIKLWTTKTWSKKPWYLGKKIKIINARLSAIRPPYEITRSPDTIDDLTTWKASSYRAFALYYFQVLEGLLPPDYFENLCDFVYGFTLLLLEKVPVDDVRKAELLFRRFVKQFEILYGIEHVGINIHFTTHWPKSVLDWGCLWATSTFIPEGFNGDLLSLCHGSQAIVEQMASNYLLQLEVRNEVLNLMADPFFSLPNRVSSLFSELLHIPNSSLVDEEQSSKTRIPVNNGHVSLLGIPCERLVTVEEEVALLNFGIEEYTISSDWNISSANFYSRFQLKENKSIFTTIKYTRSPKRTNYCALLKNGDYVLIEDILDLAPSGIPRSCVLCRKLGHITKNVYTPTPQPISDTTKIKFNHFVGQATKLVGLSPSILAIDFTDISSKAVLALNNSLTETYVATGLVNPFESD